MAKKATLITFHQITGLCTRPIPSFEEAMGHYWQVACPPKREYTTQLFGGKLSELPFMLAHGEKGNSDNFPPNNWVVYSRLGGQATCQ
jgi:hypothetical protein